MINKIANGVLMAMGVGFIVTAFLMALNIVNWITITIGFPVVLFMVFGVCMLAISIRNAYASEYSRRVDRWQNGQ